MGKLDDSFLLHVYDKLWDNVVHKENRLWTFLAIYGAAISLVVGTGVTKDWRLEVAYVLLILTYWAAEILIDADWWSVRNRLMVRGIERKAKREIVGVIPTFYNDPGYHGESLHYSSILVFCALGLIIFHLAVMRLSLLAEGTLLQTALLVGLLYAIFVAALIRCAHVREKRLEEYYMTLRDLNDQEARSGDESLTADQIEKARKDDYVGLNWRWQVCAVYLIVTLDIAYWFSSILGPTKMFVFIGTQVLFLTLFYSSHLALGSDGQFKTFGFQLWNRKTRKVTPRNCVLAISFLAVVLVLACGILTSKAKPMVLNYAF